MGDPDKNNEPLTIIPMTFLIKFNKFLFSGGKA
jgi:hypothetical protein